jgi:hypothetical protein
MMSKIVIHSDETKSRDDPGNRAKIPPLIADLGSNNGNVRVRARAALVHIGAQAVEPLILALKDRNWHVRWEAAKTLSEIGDPRSAPALVTTLEDARSGIRWLAAEGLIVIGREALPPLLQALVDHSDSEWLREGAHHVFRAWLRENHAVPQTQADEEMSNLVSLVLKALEGIEPVIATPPVAEAALEALNTQMAKASSQAPGTSSDVAGIREDGLALASWAFR